MGPSCGPDFYFHFVSWIEAQRSILDGILYPHWASGPNFGAGEPRFVFYPPLTWMTGAFLGLLVPWRAVSILLLYLLFSATGLANRALALRILSDGPATLAGCASIFLGNMLVDGYMRADYAELAGGFWIPLLLLFQPSRPRSAATLLQRSLAGVVALSLVVAGIWLTNGPLGIMASYLLLATAIASTAIEKSWAPFLRATISAALGFALAALYLVPAIWERDWANFSAAITARGYVVENGWLFAHHPAADWTQYSTSVNIHSWVAIIMFGLSALAVALAWKRGKLTTNHAYWIPLALIPLAVLLMQLPVSEPLWKLLPALRYLQFPWRWLVVMNAPLAVFFAAAVWVDPLRVRVAIATACALLFLVSTGTMFGVCFQNCHTVDTALPQVEQADGIRAKPEYAPPGIRHPLLDPGIVSNCEVTKLADLSRDPLRDLNAAQTAGPPACTGKFVKMEDHPEHKVFMGTADRAGYLILHLRSFPAWRVTVNGQPTAAMREEDYGLIAVPIPRGTVMVMADWTTTPDVWVGRGVSLLALLLLTCLYAFERRHTRAGLSLDECLPTSNR